jgi:hypothetical protein
MQSVSDALNRLHEDASWFARAHEVKLLVVRTSGDLRSTIVQALPKYEFHHDNKSAWAVFEDAHVDGDHGWQVRATRLFDHWERRREAFAKDGVTMPAAVFGSDGPPAPPRGPEPRSNDGSSFGILAPAASLRSAFKPFEEVTLAITRALRAPLEGLVIVLAPTVVDDVEAIGAQIEAMITEPLRSCRWVLVVDRDQTAPSIVARLGSAAIVCDAIADEEQQRRDFAALVSAPVMGRAGPRVTRSRRIDAPPPLDPKLRDAGLRAAGIDPAYMEAAPELARLALGGALAMKEGRGKDAVRMAREARDLAASLSLFDVTVICQIALASYLSGLDRRESAIAERGHRARGGAFALAPGVPGAARARARARGGQTLCGGGA